MTSVCFLPVDHAPPPPAASLPGAALAERVAAQLRKEEATLTASGRAALAALLRHLCLLPEDEVFVTTTFGYPNVSACVTSTIFNFCKPSRVLCPRTRAIFVIHEFGVPHPETPDLRREATRRGIPLIEDCAHGIASRAPEGWHVGQFADWVIVSLPKLFPVSKGGLLAGPKVPYAPTRREAPGLGTAAEVAAAWWPHWQEHVQRRRTVYHALSRGASEVGLNPLFEVSDRLCPWFFPVAVPCPEAVQEMAGEQGVECGLWHGSDVVIFPCHQFLTRMHVARILEVLARAGELAPSLAG